MTVFVDSSALYALVDAGQEEHEAIAAEWRELLSGDAHLITSNYVVLETVALVQRRLGMPALRDLTRDLLPSMQICWVTEEVHRAAESALLVTDRRGLSLVDCVSFEVMRENRVHTALTLDSDFMRMSFEVLPGV